MDKITFQNKYNDATSGLFKNNTTKDIGADDVRALVTDVGGNIPFTDDDSYSWPFPGITTSGGTTAYTGTLAPAITGYSNRMKVQVKINATSTGASTLNLNTQGAKKVYVNPTTQAGSGDLLIDQTYIFIYDTALDGGVGGWLSVGHPRSVTPMIYGGDWAFPAGAFPTAVNAGTLYIATVQKGNPGDTEYIPVGAWLMSTVAGANSFSQYSIKL